MGALVAVPAGAAPTWTSPIVTLDDSDTARDVDVAVDAAGNATAAWVLDGDTELSIKASTHPVGGTWSAPVDIATPGDIGDVDLATSSTSGVSVAVWSQTVGGHNVIHAATGRQEDHGRRRSRSARPTTTPPTRRWASTRTAEASSAGSTGPVPSR